MKKLFLLIFVFLIAIPVRAGEVMTVKRYYELKDKEITKNYIIGLASGFAWANTYLEIEGKPPLYCSPKNLSLNFDNYISILEKEIEKKRGKIITEYYIGLELLSGLIKTFPCNKK